MALCDTEFPCLVKKGEGDYWRCIFLRRKKRKKEAALLDLSQGSRGFLSLLSHIPWPRLWARLSMHNVETERTICQSCMRSWGLFVLVREVLVKKINHQTEGMVISLRHCGINPPLHPVKSPLPEMTHP